MHKDQDIRTIVSVRAPASSVRICKFWVGACNHLVPLACCNLHANIICFGTPRRSEVSCGWSSTARRRTTRPVVYTIEDGRR